jgi:DNA-binding NarL/FixJ family response regulator
VSGPISVVIAEDSLLVRDSVHRALSTDPDVNVVGIADDYDSAVELIDTHRPTLLFTDVRMPPTSTDEGIRLAQWMRSAYPDIGVIVLSQYADPGYVAGLLDGGTAARGYLLKERVSHFDQLSEAVHQVAAGGTVLDPLVVEALLARPSSAATLSRLTPREREVLAELATGLSNRTQRAVEKHINAIFAKLGLTTDDAVDRRVKAVLMFLGDGAP